MKRLSRTICTALAMLSFAGTMTFGVSAKSGDITTHIGTVDASALRLRSAATMSRSSVRPVPGIRWSSI